MVSCDEKMVVVVATLKDGRFDSSTTSEMVVGVIVVLCTPD